MFYKVQLKDHIRLPPKHFGDKITLAIIKQIKEIYEGYISENLGIVIDVSEVEQINEGIIIPGDGAPYYEVVFTILCFKPEMQEVLFGKIKDIADFGAFISMGPVEGMINISHTMDDFVSFSKDKVLLGKESKKSLRVGDKCRARIIAVSYKDVTNPKFGLTMRQHRLGKLEWLNEEEQPQKAKK